MAGKPSTIKENAAIPIIFFTLFIVFSLFIKLRAMIRPLLNITYGKECAKGEKRSIYKGPNDGNEEKCENYERGGL